MDAFVSVLDFNAQSAAERFDVLAQRVDLSTLDVSVLDARHAVLTDVEPCGQLDLCEARSLPELAEPVRAHLFEQASLVRLDGLSIDGDDWWCNVRPSNTEPVLRLNLEAKSPELRDLMRAQVEQVIGGKPAAGH